MKPALFIPANNFTVADLLDNPGFFSTSIHAAFYFQPTYLGDRADIESDESKLQLLPYINLLDQQGRVFCYTRGGSGEEARLHGALSIGLGGHVDTLPPDAGPSSLRGHLGREAYRELEEEVGIKQSQVHAAFSHFLVDRSNPVGRVHLGIRMVAQMKDNQVLCAEHGVITQGFFKYPSEFTREEYDRMENWSKLCLVRLAAEKYQVSSSDAV